MRTGHSLPLLSALAASGLRSAACVPVTLVVTTHGRQAIKGNIATRAPAEAMSRWSARCVEVHCIGADIGPWPVPLPGHLRS